MLWVDVAFQALQNKLTGFRNSLDTLKVIRMHGRHHLVVGPHCFLKRCRFGNYNKIYDHCRLVDISLGDRTYISEECRMYDVTIGKFTAVGPRVTMGLGIHPTRKVVSIHPLFYSRTNSACMDAFSDKNYFVEHRPITVGHDVWIGANVIVQDGVTIGNGAVIGAGAVVTGDIPPYALATGVPAKVKRFRFEPDQIEFLETFRWWDREADWLRKHYKEFHDIDRFMARHGDNL